MEENDEKIEKIHFFLQRVILDDLQKLQRADLSYMHFVVMGQVIEVLGGFWDNKPIKARGQSSRRFSAAVKYLFGGRYRSLNDNGFLYDKLRTQMTHTFMPAQDVLLLNKAEKNFRHLHYTSDHKLVLIAEDFYRDICKACERLEFLLREGQLKPKNIVLQNEE